MPAARMVLLIVAFVLFALRAFGVTHSRVDLTAAGLACFTLSALL